MKMTPKQLLTTGLVSITLALAATPTLADPGYGPGMSGPEHAWRHDGQMRARMEQVNQRQERQFQRILGGMERGQLNMREAIALLREHQEINALERRYLADGRLGPMEMQDLERRLDEASNHIRFERHDDERRGEGRRW